MNRAPAPRLALGLAIDSVILLVLGTLFQIGPIGAPAWAWVLWTCVISALIIASLRRFGCTPGLLSLGVWREGSHFAVAQRWRSREAWWTTGIAIAAFAEGSKEAIRFTTALPPPPWFGLVLAPHWANAWLSTLGVATMTCALGVLACAPRFAAASIVLAAVQTTSWLVSLPAIPAWVAARSAARSAQIAQPIPVGEITRLTWLLPAGSICGNFIALLCMICVYRRFLRMRRTA